MYNTEREGKNLPCNFYALCEGRLCSKREGGGSCRYHSSLPRSRSAQSCCLCAKKEVFCKKSVRKRSCNFCARAETARRRRCIFCKGDEKKKERRTAAALQKVCRNRSWRARLECKIREKCSKLLQFLHKEEKEKAAFARRAFGNRKDRKDFSPSNNPSPDFKQ